MKFSRVVLGLALLAAVMMFVSGSGTRFGLWAFPVGFQVLKWAAFLGAGVAVLALVSLLVPKLRKDGRALLVVAIALGVTVAAVPAYWLQVARKAPPIHDITTDLDNPPAFVAVVALRGDGTNSVEHRGAALAETQRSAYPDLLPLTVAHAPADAFALAVRAARAMGWEIVAEDAGQGRIEATATTFWFGFKDDVVVRISPAGTGSRIDVRSLSRVGVGDAGANAARIRKYLARIAA